MKTLLLARTVKSYWATNFAKKRVSKVFAPFDSSPFWRILGGIFSPVLYFFVTFAGFLKSKNFDLVIAADPRIGIIFGILKRVFGRKTQILVHQLILSEPKNNFKERILKLAFSEINGAVVNSSDEARFFSKRFTKTKFYFVPLHSDPRCFELSKTKRVDGYIFSGGGAERDFETLVKAAKKNNQKFLIVTFSKKNLARMSLPKNLEVKFNVREGEYFKLIANSKFVVVPLKKTGRSAGQTTVVQAMSTGKAVIATNVPGLTDYIENGRTGILVGSESIKDLADNIGKLLKNSSELSKISKAALEFAQRNFTYRVYDMRIGKVIKSFIKV